MNLLIGRRAQQQADRKAQWWANHRPAVSTLFADELERTFRLLLGTPGAGVSWPTPRRPRLRRILMPQTGNHVYFEVDATGQTVQVLAIWGAPRGRSPSL